ncbi:hypothetical protein [Natronoarchaeum philippinense]|nr:hypothetical protein [Natronoarchaeum philippinense]
MQLPSNPTLRTATVYLGIGATILALVALSAIVVTGVYAPGFATAEIGRGVLVAATIALVVLYAGIYAVGRRIVS